MSTPLFFISNQLDKRYFERTTCGVTSREADFSDYTVGWRQGILTLAEAMSADQPDNGWFLPNCDTTPSFLDDRFPEARRKTKVGLLEDDSEKLNVLQVLYNWLNTGEKHQAVDAFGVPNEACSRAKSLPLDLRPDVILPDPVTLAAEEEAGRLGAIKRGPSSRFGPFFRGLVKLFQKNYFTHNTMFNT